jgi:hypothetical protein
LQLEAQLVLQVIAADGAAQEPGQGDGEEAVVEHRGKAVLLEVRLWVVCKFPNSLRVLGANFVDFLHKLED